MTWWLWLLLGLALLAFEIATPGGFYFVFFGVAALVVGFLAAAGLGEPVWVDWLFFSVLSVASLALFRGRLRAMLQKTRATAASGADLVGGIAVLLDDLTPGAVGKAEMRGTVWSVRSSADQRLERGQRCRVDHVEGLTLWVRPE